jgi:hypothetical protein
MMNDEVIILENIINADGLRRVHLMSNIQFELSQIKEQFGGEWEPVVTREVGVYHLRGEWKHEGMTLMSCEGWPQPKRMALLPLQPGVRISETITKAAFVFLADAQLWPGYGFVRRLPKGIHNGVEVDGILVFESEWMPEKFVAVCAGIGDA